MANGKRKPEAQDRDERIGKLGQNTTHIIQQAAQLLDEEMAAGIVAARAAQRRFGKDGKFSGEDFKDLLAKFRTDSHSVIRTLGEQLAQLRNDDNQAIIDRFLGHSHDLLDLTLDTIQVGAEFANRSLGPRLAPKKGAGAAGAS